jgi:hypothetical protein
MARILSLFVICLGLAEAGQSEALTRSALELSPEGNVDFHSQQKEAPESSHQHRSIMRSVRRVLSADAEPSKPAVAMELKAKTAEQSKVQQAISSKTKESEGQAASFLSRAVSKMSPWLVSFLTTAVAMALFMVWRHATSMLINPTPRGSDSQHLSTILQEAIQKVRQLEEQLETRREVDDMFADGDSDAEGEDAVTAGGGDIQAKIAVSSAAQLAERTQQLTEDAAKVQEKFGEFVQDSQSKMEDFAKKESAVVYDQIKKAWNDDEIHDDVDAWNLPPWMIDNGQIKLPPLMQLVSGMFAASQIRFTRYWNNCCITLDMVIIGIAAAICLADWSKPCKDIEIWVYVIGMSVHSLLDLSIRYYLVRRCDDAMDLLSEGNDSLIKTDDRVNVMNELGNLQKKGGSFFDAFTQHQHIMETWAYALTSALSFMHLVWGIFGVYTSIVDVVEDDLGCKASNAVSFMHVYSFIFFTLLTWQLLILLSGALEFVTGSPFVRVPLIKAAKNFDDNSLKGMPLMLTLVQSFVLKDSAQVYSMRARQVFHEIHELEDAIQEQESKLTRRKLYMEEVYRQSQEVTNEQEYVRRCEERVQTTLKEAKPLVGLLAANVQSTNAGPDPTAAGSSTSYSGSSNMLQKGDATETY